MIDKFKDKMTIILSKLGSYYQNYYSGNCIRNTLVFKILMKILIWCLNSIVDFDLIIIKIQIMIFNVKLKILLNKKLKIFYQIF